MKKIIFTGTVLMTFLIGCSVTKNTHQATSPIEQQKSLMSYVQQADPQILRAELKKHSLSELNALTDKGETLYDIALARGSVGIIQALLENKVSPYKPNEKGLSLYLILNTNSPFDQLTTKSLLSNIYIEKLEVLSSIINSPDQSVFFSKIENFEIPCDEVIKKILYSDNVTISISTLLAHTPSCKYSLSANNAKKIYERLLQKTFSSNFANFPEVLAFYPLLPQDLRYIKIKDYTGGIYTIHTEVIIKTFRQLNPIKADQLLAIVDQYKNNNDVAIIFSWLKDPKDKQSIEDKIIQRFNEPLDSSTSIAINNLIIAKFSPKDQQ